MSKPLEHLPVKIAWQCFIRDFWIMLVIFIGFGLYDTYQQAYDREPFVRIAIEWGLRAFVVALFFYIYYTALERAFQAWILKKDVK